MLENLASLLVLCGYTAVAVVVICYVLLFVFAISKLLINILIISRTVVREAL